MFIGITVLIYYGELGGCSVRGEYAKRQMRVMRLEILLPLRESIDAILLVL